MNKILMAGPSITDVEKKTVAKMMSRGWDNYEYVEKFESDFAKWHNRKYSLMTPCCTQAIHLLLLTIGIKEYDEVIVPECTWTGSVAPITYCKATPVFADIDPVNWCLSPDSVEKNITNKTKAIIFVDLYGNMPNVDELEKISKKYKIPLIEDAAEALGSKYKNIRAGKFGVGSVHSFHRTKTLTTGEGGALLLDNSKLYKRAKFLRDHGRSSKNPYYTLEATPKYMPSNLQGAMACAQFKRIDELINRKRYHLHSYKKELKNINDIQFNMETKDVYNGAWASTIVFGKSHKINKKLAIKKLQENRIPARPFFYPLSSMPAYKKYKTGSKKKNPISYDISSRGITLAGHYNLTNKQIKIICNGIKKILK
jgi:perosamine synthetase